ncbi:MAG: DinB family protein [Blastocatellia bacterium]
MQTEATRLAEQLRTAMEGDAWHGDALLQVLAGVTAEQAAAHPIPGAHSIWELALHLRGTYGLVLRRLAGDDRQLSLDEDWPIIPASSAENWAQALGELKRLNDELRQAVLRFPADRLDEPLVPEPAYTAYTQFIGITQHNLYHAGQIAILRKAL